MDDLPKPTFGSSGLALFILAVVIFLYALQVQGLWTGLGLAFLFLLLVPIGNSIALMRFESLKMGTYLRWVFFALIMAGIAASGTEVCKADGQCSALL